MIRKLVFHALGVMLVMMLLWLFYSWRLVSDYNEAAQNFWRAHHPPTTRTPLPASFRHSGQLRRKHSLTSARPMTDSGKLKPCAGRSLPRVPLRIDYRGQLQALCGFRRPYTVDLQYSTKAGR